MSISAKLGLVFLRLFFGAYLVCVGFSRIQNADWPNQLGSDLGRWSSQREAARAPCYQSEGLYKRMDEMGRRHVEALAEVLRWSELLLGAMIFVGLFHPLALLAQLLLDGGYLILAGHASEQIEQAQMAFLAIALALLLTRAGRFFGVDSFLHDRWGHSFLGRLIS